MKIPLSTLNELLAYHYDRRERLYEFLAKLTTAEFARDIKVGWQSIRGLLLHSLEAEVFWVQHVIQRGERPDWSFEAFPDLGAVRAQAGRVRAQTMAFVETLTDSDLERELSVTYSDGSTIRFTLSKAFLHVITHDTHHRAQAQAAARQMGYEPPELDLM